APQDFVQLQSAITSRIEAVLRKHQDIAQVAALSPIKDTEGLSQHEIVALVTVMQNSFITEQGVSPWRIRDDMIVGGCTDLAYALPLQWLPRRLMVSANLMGDVAGTSYSSSNLITGGEEWSLPNQDRLVLRPSRSAERETPGSDEALF